MILTILALMLQTVPVTAEETDIVVIGHRLRQVSVIVGRDARGKFTCSLNRSSGRARLDAQLCRAAAQCVRQKARDVGACVDARKPELLDDVRRSLGRAR